MKEMYVDKSKCIKCGICVESCSNGIITFGEDGFPMFAQGRQMRCIECGQCVLFCPECANMLSFMDKDNTVKMSELAMPTAEETLNLLMTRRSIRRFKDEPISRETFAKLFEAVRQAPSAVNSQKVRWIVSENREKTEEITKLVIGWLKEEIEKAPRSFNARIGKAMIAKAEKGEDGLLRGAAHAAIAVVPKDYAWYEDGAIALTYLELAAHGMGIGCCWGGFLTMAIRNYAPLREFLKITDEEHICGAQLMGWPQIKPVRNFAPRRELSVEWI